MSSASYNKAAPLFLCERLVYRKLVRKKMKELEEEIAIFPCPNSRIGLNELHEHFCFNVCLLVSSKCCTAS